MYKRESEASAHERFAVGSSFGVSCLFISSTLNRRSIDDRSGFLKKKVRITKREEKKPNTRASIMSHTRTNTQEKYANECSEATYANIRAALREPFVGYKIYTALRNARRKTCPRKQFLNVSEKWNRIE